MPTSLINSLLSPFHVKRSLMLFIVRFMPQMARGSVRMTGMEDRYFSVVSPINLTICVLSNGVSTRF